MGVIDLLGLVKPSNQFRGFGGLRNRQKQIEHRLAVLLPGILLKRPAERFVPHFALRRQAVGERGQERERIVRVPLVLGQVQRDAPDEPPERAPGAEIRLGAAGVMPAAFKRS